MKKLFNKLNKNLIKILILLILLTLYIFISALNYANFISSDLSNNIFRLHVIANSDSTQDQMLKYKVRDNLIDYMKEICKDSNSKEETIQIVNNHLTDFNNIVNKTIENNGFKYTSNTCIENLYFPTKKYGDISLPEGFYDAIDVKIGKAEGKNWWCVLYPSLCFVDIKSGIVPEESKETLKNSLNSEEYELISNKEDISLKFKFKLLEIFAKHNLLLGSFNS